MWSAGLEALVVRSGPLGGRGVRAVCVYVCLGWRSVWVRPWGAGRHEHAGLSSRRRLPWSLLPCWSPLCVLGFAPQSTSPLARPRIASTPCRLQITPLPALRLFCLTWYSLGWYLQTPPPKPIPPPGGFHGRGMGADQPQARAQEGGLGGPHAAAGGGAAVAAAAAAAAVMMVMALGLQSWFGVGGACGWARVASKQLGARQGRHG